MKMSYDTSKTLTNNNNVTFRNIHSFEKENSVSPQLLLA